MLTQEPVKRLVGFGTCLFVLQGDDFVVAAIDSRRNTKMSHEDSACKITCLDDQTIFLCQGIVEGWGSTASNVAKAAFAGQLETPKDLYKLASAWSDEMCKQLSTLDKADPFTRDAIEQQGASGVFLGHSAAGNLMVLNANIDERDLKFVTSIETSSSGGCISTGGFEHFFEEALCGATARATRLRQSVGLPPDDEAKSWALKAETCVRAAIEWSGSNTIGGQIATIILRQGQKYEWVHRPSFC
jgi:hypothetical protein